MSWQPSPARRRMVRDAWGGGCNTSGWNYAGSGRTRGYERAGCPVTGSASARRTGRGAPRNATPQRRPSAAMACVCLCGARSCVLTCASFPCQRCPPFRFTPCAPASLPLACPIFPQPPPGRRRRRLQRSRRSACSSGPAASPPQPAPQRQSCPRTRACSSYRHERHGVMRPAIESVSIATTGRRTSAIRP